MSLLRAGSEAGVSRIAALFVLYLIGFLTIGALGGKSLAPAQEPAKQTASASTPAEFIGSETCAQCHSRQYGAWRASQHAAAMQEANAQTMLGRFDGATFDKDGVVSTFFTKNGKFWIRADGPEGKLEDYQVRYTFGIAPLQQYLIELPGGRLQAFGIAWDARSKEDGGQRWFDLYPGQALKAGNPLHWTGIDQNWNYQCAYCHSTNLKKNYDASTGHFNTTWSEISVGCEACHGPASQHVAWESKGVDWALLEAANQAFVARFDERKSVSWPISPSGSSTRSVPRKTAKEIEACAACHARRQQFADANGAMTQGFHDAFRPSLLEHGHYHPDGQQLEEVYNHVSFLQSRMHAAGVTCSDCHDPHTEKIKLPGNALCGQCHSPEIFDTPAHHHHAAGAKGSECARCHMPTKAYMIVDPRHDHSMRIPRPDLSYLLGTPNACNACHADKTASWAADAVKTWYPNPKPGFQTFARAFDLADRGAPGAQAELVRIAEDPSQSAVARASVVARLGRFLSQRSLPVVGRALKDSDPSVRVAAVGALSSIEPRLRLELLRPLLEDEARVVRADVARALAGEPEHHLTPADREKFERALEEYISAERFNAERPEHQTNLASLFLERGQRGDAEAAARTAIAIDPSFAPAYVALSEIPRSSGDERAAENALREGLERNPKSAELLHALGLSFVRQKRMPEAIEKLSEAAQLAPDVPRFSFVAGVALHDSGRPVDAMELMRAGLARNPYDRDLLQTLATYEVEAGQVTLALDRAKLLQELEPDNREVHDLMSRVKRLAR